MTSLRISAISLFIATSFSAQANPAIREFASGFVPVEIFKYAPNGEVICLIEGFQMYEFVYENNKVVYSTSGSFLIGTKGEEMRYRQADFLVMCRDRKFIRLQVFNNK